METTDTLDKIALDLGEGLALEQTISTDVERQIIRINKYFDPVEPFWQEILSQIIGDEDSSNEQLERLERDVSLGVKIVRHGSRKVDESAESSRSSITLNCRLSAFFLLIEKE